MSNIETCDRPPPRPRRVQFTIRSMLLLTTGVAVACSFIFSLPPWGARQVVLCVCVLVPPSLIAAIIFGTSGDRAFAVGTLIPWLLFWLLVAWFVMDCRKFPKLLSITDLGRYTFAVGWFLCFLSGYCTYRWIRSRALSKHAPFS